MPARSKDLLWIVAALAAHAAAFVATSRLHTPSPAAEEAPAEIDLAVEPEAPPAAPASREEPPSAIPAAAMATHPIGPPVDVRAASSLASLTAAEASARSEASAPPATSGEPGPAGPEGLPPPTFSADELGLGGRNIFIGHLPVVPGAPAAGPPPDTASNVAPGIDRSLRDALQAKDHEIGFDIGAPVVGVAEEVARTSDTPMDSRATFEVTIDETGTITAVRLVDASQAHEAWSRVAASLATALRAKRIAMRGHAGAVVTLGVDSRWALPSGSRAGHPIGAPSGRDPSTGADCALSRGGGCMPTTAFDVSDIGARPSRQVHARILNERLR